MVVTLENNISPPNIKHYYVSILRCTPKRNETHAYTKTCTKMLMGALYQQPECTQCKCLSTVTQGVGPVQTMGYRLATEK